MKIAIEALNSSTHKWVETSIDAKGSSGRVRFTLEDGSAYDFSMRDGGVEVMQVRGAHRPSDRMVVMPISGNVVIVKSAPFE